MKNDSNNHVSRRKFISSAAIGGMSGLSLLNNPLGSFASPPEPDNITYPPSSVEPNMIGSYGPWADNLYGDAPGRLSLRNDKWTDVEAWKKAAQSRFIELLARPDTGGTPEVTVLSRHSFDGLVIEKLSWQLPYGPPTEAFFLKPEGADGPLPGVVALHDHGGNKYFGKRKITQTSDEVHPAIPPFQEHYYGGRSWANELAKRGFAVLVPDAFAFGSRRVRLQDVSPSIRRNVKDVSPEEGEEEIQAYNRWASDHEHILSKSLFCAGTTWPGVFVSEDQRALDVLEARPEVDEERMGCCGLSGGGLRTLMLSGVDPRIKTSVCVGMMSTWRDYLMYHSHTHTWMIYVPHLPREMDYSEIITLQMPASRLVLNNSEDGLFDLGEQKRADTLLREVFKKAGAGDRYACEFHAGGHKFNRPMQESAFGWFEKWL
ncbi:MAG: hypothetical protein WD266_07415 [Balneolales bacterium]